MQRTTDRWVSIALSVLLHGALLGALVYGWLLFRRPPAPRPTLAIEATVVQPRAVRGAVQPPPQPAPPVAPQPAPVQEEPSGPPQPTPEELAQREQERQKAREAADEQRRAAEQRAAAEAAAQAKRAQEERHAEEQRQAEARAAAERKVRAEAQKRAAQEQQRLSQAQDESARQELQRSLAAEEHADTPRSSAAVANWESLIAAKITRAWLRPPTARPGLQCLLNVTQVPGGVVTKVSIGQCNADQAVRDSIEAAVYRASPLPPPPPGAQFDPDLHINFKPD